MSIRCQPALQIPTGYTPTKTKAWEMILPIVSSNSVKRILDQIGNHFLTAKKVSDKKCSEEYRTDFSLHPSASTAVSPSICT